MYSCNFDEMDRTFTWAREASTFFDLRFPSRNFGEEPMTSTPIGNGPVNDNIDIHSQLHQDLSQDAHLSDLVKILNSKNEKKEKIIQEIDFNNKILEVIKQKNA